MKVAMNAKVLLGLLALTFAHVRGAVASKHTTHLRRNPLPRGSGDAVNAKKGSLKPRKLDDENRARSRTVATVTCGGKDGGGMGYGKNGGGMGYGKNGGGMGYGKDGGGMGYGKDGGGMGYGKDGGGMGYGKDGGGMGYGKAGKGGRRRLNCVCPEGSGAPCSIEGDPFDDPVTRINDQIPDDAIPLHDDSELGLTGDDEDEDEPSGDYTGGNGGDEGSGADNGSNSWGGGGGGSGNVAIPDPLPVVDPDDQGNDGDDGGGDEEETSNEDIDIGLEYAKYVPSNDADEGEFEDGDVAANKALDTDVAAIMLSVPAGPPSNDY